MAEEKKTAAKKPAAKPAAKAAAKPATKAAAKPAAKPASKPKTPKAPKEIKEVNRGYRKARRGYVVSDKMDKTIVVLVEERKKHPLYGKVMRLSKKIKAHDEQNTAGIGDLVLINETRPLSATKNWRLVEILEKAK
ncbi:MAG: 30S ribosomal protein S17 [Candidatus Aquiluna sp. XM-24bin5]|nr:MAG: 30S ribosomal protein S17 [Candidatus Aquiluna sp. XM-24bin5]